MYNINYTLTKIKFILNNHTGQSTLTLIFHVFNGMFNELVGASD